MLRSKRCSYLKRLCMGGIVGILASHLLMGWLLLSGESVYAAPEETQVAIDDLNSRLLELNNTISNGQVKKEELEASLNGLNADFAQQSSELEKLSKEMRRVEAKVQKRVRAIQVNEKNQSLTLLNVGEWATIFQSIQSAGTVKKSDRKRVEALGKLYKQVEEKQALCKEKKEAVETTKSELERVIQSQEQTKAELEQELKANEVLLAEQKEEERQQELARKAEQERLMEAIQRAQEERVQQEQVQQEQVQQAQARKEQAAQTQEAKETGTSLTLPSSEEVDDKAQRIILSAKKFLGTPYVWGGTSPSGFDCSGLVQWVYRENGILLPRVSQAQQQAATPIPVEDVRPGDLVFWGTPAHHVGIYIGEGYYIHAPQPGEVVKVTHRSYYPFSGAGRVLTSE